MEYSRQVQPAPQRITESIHVYGRFCSFMRVVLQERRSRCLWSTAGKFSLHCRGSLSLELCIVASKTSVVWLAGKKVQVSMEYSRQVQPALPGKSTPVGQDRTMSFATVQTDEGSPAQNVRPLVVESLQA